MEVVIAHSFLSLKDPWHDTRGFVAIFFARMVVGTVLKVLAVWQVLVRCSYVSFLSANEKEIKTCNSIKNQRAH